MLKKMNKRNKVITKSILTVIIILLSNFIQIWFLSFGQVRIINFQCNAELIGGKRYRADVFQEIEFMFDIEAYEDKYAILGDGTVLFNITDSSFTHKYEVEGIYNVSLTALGISGPDTDWLIIEVDNEEPNFDIGYSSVEYHEAPYDFEDKEVGELPDDWDVYNNEGGFYLDNITNLYPGLTLEGGVEDLIIEDQQSWKIETEWTGGNYRYIDLFLHFNQTEDHDLTSGEYKLYFSANDSMVLFGYNPDLGENEILFNGNYSNGQVITIIDPNNLELFASYYIENWGVTEIIAIDWFKLERVYKGVQIVNDDLDHGKVVEMDFGNNNNYCFMDTSFTSQLYGTIEFWYRTSNTKIGGTLSSNLLNLGIIQKDNAWFVGSLDITDPSDPNVVNPVPKPINNTWHHIRIDWNNGISIYEGLILKKFKVYIDNNASKDLGITESGIGLNNFKFETRGEILIDAIGFSWDDNYDISDNIDTVYPEHLYEDLEITFSVVNLEESDIDKSGFSYEIDSEVLLNYSYIWDFGDGNYSSEENPTHKFSNEGEFPVRLTLVDDQGAMRTKVKIFNIENKDPETEIVYGLNNEATFDFKFDVNEQPPSDWYTRGNIKVIDYKDEFSKVVEIDTLAGGYSLIRIPEPKIDINGSVEFWIYFSDVQNDEFFFWIDKLPFSESNPFALRNSTRFGFLDGKWMRYYTYKGPSDEDRYAYGEIIELDTPKNNEWTHVRFDYCWEDTINYKGLTGKQWRIFVNGNASNIYDGVGNTFNRKGFDIRSGSHIFLESIGFTTDPDYSLADNNPERVESYYGTWDFRFYPNGAIPYDETLEASVLGPWMFGSYNFQEFADECGAYILPELDEHKKVLELKDNNNSDLVFASLLDFSEATYGTMEFWLRTSDISQGLAMAFGHEVFDTGIWLTNEGNWAFKDGDDYIEILDIPKMQNNTWHHIRVDFDCRDNGGYLDLGEDEFYFSVDGNSSISGPFQFDDPVSNFAWNIWSTLAEGYNYSIYLDGIGASWDPAYEIGDNIAPREGIVADTEIIFSADAMDTATDKESLRYLWNFGDNQTAFGQTVLHTFTRSGKYKVKLIALDDNGLYDTYESYIWIDNYYPSINILDINFGYATYDFSTNDVGEFPDDWFASALEDLYSNTEIVGTVDGFSKVVQIGDGPGFGGIWTSDVIGIPYNQTQPGDLSLKYGSVEFWLYCTDTSQTHFYISLFEDGYQDGIFLEFNNGTWSHDLVPITFDNSWELQNNTWTHIRLDFCCDDSSYMGLENDTFLVYGDDFSSQILTMLHDNHPDISNITCFGIYSEMSAGEYGKLYVDNFGFSWDPEYEVGDNKIFYVVNQFNEGETIILDCLSYDTFTDYQQLVYNWGDLYLDIGAWEDFGWHYSYTFTNNDDGDELEGYPIVSFIGDPLYAWDVDSYYIDVDNILPTLSIHSVNVITNISAEIYSYGLDSANFTIFLSSSAYNETIFSIDIPTDYPENIIDLNSTLVSLDVSEDWIVIVNQTWREGGTHDVILNFEFENGYQNQHTFVFDGVESILSFDLNDMWIDLGNNISLVPLTFDATLTDPSDDKIDLSINYITDIVYEVDSGTPLMSENYTIEHEPFDLFCNFFIIDDAGTKFAHFKFIEQIQDTWTLDLISGIFPVSYDFSFNADLTDLDLHLFINDVFSAEGIGLISHESTNYTISASYNEIEPISEIQTTEINYRINEYFKFQNLAPSISIHAPVNVSEDQLVIYFADVKDFNKDNINITFSFGINRGSGLKYREPFYLGNNRYAINYSYSNAGGYLIYVNATDGIQETKKIQLIEVVNVLPYAKIRTYQNETFEDEFIKFTADFYDTPSDIQSLRHFWDFGDGVFSAEMSPSYAYHQAGTYQIRLHLKDNNGGEFCATYELTVLEQPPLIIGPFALQGLEGQTIVLDVGVSDSLSDYIMNYRWDIYNAKRAYSATYDFMEFDEGVSPNYSNIEYDSISDINYRIVDDISTHYKVLEINDNNEILGGAWRLRYGDSGSTYGTIEFWLRSSYMAPNQDNIIISLSESSAITVPIAVFDNNTWFYQNLYNGSKTIIGNIPLIESNKWHHIRIDFECSTGNYLDLNENFWRISVDGINSIDIPMQFSTLTPHDDVNFLDTLELKSGGTNVNSIYCDAIGYYDSTSQYQIGDNLNQEFYSQDYIKTVYGAKPSVAFDEGTYIIDLLVENEQSSQAEITLEVLNIAPIITVSNKKYYGGKGYIDITAYASDSYIDYESLEFDWEIEGERVLLQSGTLSSSIEIYCESSKTIKGQVTVRDPMDSYATKDFMVQIFMDSNGDGYSDEYEALYNITSPDMDGDGLPNFYEGTYLGTDPLKRDTDDDGLSDGYDDLFYSGELSIGTNPLDNDTDNDLLIDGFEWFGWSCTIMDTQGQKTFNYTSNPLLKDTDGDLLDDYEEFLYKTNPNVVDSDNDGLSDYLEVMVHGSNPNNPDTDTDGIIDGIEVEIGTHFNLTDTDGDSIQDGAEYYGWDFITDPLSKDSDHDFLVDITETIQYYFKIDGRKDISEPAILSFDEDKTSKAASANMMFLLAYSETTSNELLSDIKVRIYKQDSELILFDETIRTSNIDRYFTRSFEIKDIIENARNSYFGNYILKVSFLDELHGDLCLEEFSITVNKYLDPNNEDYDGDGILDGVETQLIVEGIEVIEFLDLGNITTDTNLTTYDTYDFEISDIGFIDSANISFTIVSNATLLGDGYVAVELIQNDLDYRVKDISILSSNITFSSSEVFHENYTVSPLSHDLYELSGKYQLKINIYDTIEADVFKAIDIKVSVDGYRPANSFDTEAWLTEPDKNDSDDDGWSDYYEIYRNHPTNPLSWDTDGDGAKDSVDINPLFNMMIEVKFIEGHVGDLPKWYIMAQSKPILQMTVNYNLHGEALAYVSPHVKASKDYEKAGIIFKKKYPGTSVFGHKYYIDIEDDTRSMWLQFKLWDEGLGGIDALWDTKKKTVTKTLLLLGEIQDGKSYDVGSESGTNWLTAKITMKALSHANTVAIYENETLFNGHYNKHQRMNVFQIVVTTAPDPLKSPFILGTNILLIPTEALLNTELNSILVNGSSPIELEDTFLANGEFISLDRDDLPEISSNNVESIFVIECTADEADQLIIWAITGMINESANITGIINGFASTKLDDFIVELMNVHLDVLGLVPIINPYPNDYQGSMPKEDGEWWADLGAAILGAIVGFFASPFVAIAALIAIVIYVIILIIAIVIAAAVLAILALLEAILLGLILIFVYIMFGISWLISMAILALMALGFAAFADGMQLVANFATRPYEEPILPPPSVFEYDGWTMLFELIGAFKFTSGIRTDFVYSEFMGCSLPTIETFTIADIYAMDFTFRMDFSFSIEGLIITTEGIPLGEDLWEDEGFWTQFLNVLGSTFSICGAFFSLVGGLLAFLDIATGSSGAIISIAGFIVSLLIFFLTTLEPANEKGDLKTLFFGLALGLLISGVIILLPLDYLKNVPKWLEELHWYSWQNLLIDAVTVVGMVPFFPSELTKVVIPLATGLFALFTGASMISVIKNDATKKAFQNVLGMLCIGLGIFLLTMALREE